MPWLANRRSRSASIRAQRLERETGIEPATNSLEGCDSTTELLPPPRLTPCRLLRRFHLRALRFSGQDGGQTRRSKPSTAHRLANRSLRAYRLARAKVGGEGRVRTSVARWAADLQSAAIDRSATSPLSRRSLICWSPCFRRVPEDPLRTMNSGAGGRRGSLRWSWRRDLNPRPADYKSAALPD